MTRRGSIFLSTANEIGSALVTKLGGSGYAPKEWGKKANIMGIASEDIPDALANLTPSAGGGDRGSIEITLANEIGAVLNKKFQTERGFKPKEWASAISKLTPLQVKTASGAIASFSDGADAVPLTSLIANIDPKQDLHGYSKPWAPGAGKNKLENTLTTQVVNGTTFTVNADKSITISGTPSTQTRVYIHSGDTYTVNVASYFSFGTMPTGTRVFCTKTYNGSTTYPTISPSHTANDIGAVYSNILLEIGTSFNGTAFTIYPQIEAGSSATSYEPYSNVCPIEGSAETTMTHRGKNFLANAEIVQCSFNSSGGDATVTTRIRTQNYIPLKAGTYKIENKEGYPYVVYVYSTNSSSGYISGESLTSWQTYGTTFTLANDRYVRIGWRKQIPTANITPDEIHRYIMYNTSDSTENIVVSFGRTVYGGELDVVTGILTAKWKKIVADGVNVKATGGYASGANRLPTIQVTDATSTSTDIKADYLVTTSSAIGTEGSIMLGNSGASIVLHIGTIQGNDGTHDYSSDAELLAACNSYLADNNLTILYKLKEENYQTYQLDPHEVESYLGGNSFYNTTGNTSASYYADIDLDNA